MYIHDFRFPDPSKHMTYIFLQTSSAMLKIMEEACSGEDINLAQFRILKMLDFHDRALTSSEICHCIFRESQTVAASVNRLLERGYVIKIPDQNDKRFMRIQITEKGNQLQQKIRQHSLTLMTEITKCFSEDELEQFNAYLDKLHNWVFDILGIDLVEPIDTFHGER